MSDERVRVPVGAAYDFDDATIALGRPGGEVAVPKLESAPLLDALRKAGTSHVYADTADDQELAAAIAVGERGIVAEVDGSTVNQPLAAKVVGRYLDAGDPKSWAKALRARRPGIDDEELLALLYAILCGRMGNDVVRAFAARRRWEVSLQIHMALVRRPDTARGVGRLLRKMVSPAIVKVPFAPHAPGMFLVARDLEREAIPVNFTSTFSARQVVAAALLANVARTNVFMGRLAQGLSAERLGEHVDLEAQRALLRLRRDHGLQTQLIVASLREWRSIALTAGCDIYTAPIPVLRGFLEQNEVAPGALESRLETSYEDDLGIDAGVEKRLGREKIARLWRVEPEFVEFLVDYRGSEEYRDLQDGETLARRFEEAGFGDFFHAPDDAEWKELRDSKLPELDGSLTGRIALDTEFSLRADADFDRHQESIDAEVRSRL